MHAKRRGFSLTELVIVIIIIAILSAIGLAVGGKQVSLSREKTTTNQAKLIGSNIENAVVDLGFLDAATVKANPTALLNYLTLWDMDYLSSPLDLINIHLETEDDSAFMPDYRGAWVETVGYDDAWGCPLRMYYLAPVSGSGMYRIIVASSGPNSQWADDAETGYANAGFEDDIVLIMEPRAHSS